MVCLLGAIGGVALNANVLMLRNCATPVVVAVLRSTATHTSGARDTARLMHIRGIVPARTLLPSLIQIHIRYKAAACRPAGAYGAGAAEGRPSPNTVNRVRTTSRGY